MRKALDTLTAENLLIRRQGRGTFVAEHDDRQSVFRFFKLRTDREGAGTPSSRVVAITEGAANVDERDRLALVRSAQVVRVERVRSLDERPCITETLAVPLALFPGLAALELPNTLYSLYAARFGVSISGAKEQLRAVALPAYEAGLLGACAGRPALEINRVAFNLDDTPVEWRLSFCLTQDMYYLSELR